MSARGKSRPFLLHIVLQLLQLGEAPSLHPLAPHDIYNRSPLSQLKTQHPREHIINA